MNTQDDQKNLENDGLFPNFSLDKAQEYIQNDILFKVHVYASFILSASTFVAWFFTQFYYPTIPWFFFLCLSFCVTLTIHYYYFLRIKEILQLHFALFVIINFGIFCIWLFMTNTGGLTWFIYILIGTSMPLSIHYLMNRHKTNPLRNIYIHVSLFSLLNLLIFIIYLQTHDKFPYFLFCFFGLLIPLAVHWFITFHFQNLFFLHLYLFVIIQTIVFCIWVTTGMHWPWFGLFFFPGVFFLTLHYRAVEGFGNQKNNNNNNNIQDNNNNTNSQITNANANANNSTEVKNRLNNDVVFEIGERVDD